MKSGIRINEPVISRLVQVGQQFAHIIPASKKLLQLAFSKHPNACCESKPVLNKFAFDSDLINDSIRVDRFAELWLYFKLSE